MADSLPQGRRGYKRHEVQVKNGFVEIVEDMDMKTRMRHAASAPGGGVPGGFVRGLFNSGLGLKVAAVLSGETAGIFGLSSFHKSFLDAQNGDGVFAVPPSHQILNSVSEEQNVSSTSSSNGVSPCNSTSHLSPVSDGVVSGTATQFSNESPMVVVQGGNIPLCGGVSPNSALLGTNISRQISGVSPRGVSATSLKKSNMRGDSNTSPGIAETGYLDDKNAPFLDAAPSPAPSPLCDLKTEDGWCNNNTNPISNYYININDMSYFVPPSPIYVHPFSPNPTTTHYPPPNPPLMYREESCIPHVKNETNSYAGNGGGGGQHSWENISNVGEGGVEKTRESRVPDIKNDDDTASIVTSAPWREYQSRAKKGDNKGGKGKNLINGDKIVPTLVNENNVASSSWSGAFIGPRCGPWRKSENDEPLYKLKSNSKLWPWKMGKDGNIYMYLCTFIVGIFVDNDFRVAKRLIGPGGSYMKNIAKETGGRLRLRGKGSNFKEKDFKDKESPEPLQICAVCHTLEDYRLLKRKVGDLLDKIHLDHRKIRGHFPDMPWHVIEHPLNPAFERTLDVDFW